MRFIIIVYACINNYLCVISPPDIRTCVEILKIIKGKKN